MSTTQPLDDHTIETIRWMRDVEEGRVCACGHSGDDDETLWPLSRIADLMAAGVLDSSGYVRCAGWAKSARRQCLHRAPGFRLRYSGCGRHPGAWLWPETNREDPWTWLCEHHAEPARPQLRLVDGAAS